MNRTERNVWIALFVVALLLAIYWWLHRGNTTVNEGNPNYLNFNYTSGPYNGTAGGLPAMPPNTGNSCGCSGGGVNSGIYASLNQMMSAFTSGASNIMNAYYENIMSGFPPGYLNNAAGVAASQSAQSTLINPDSKSQTVTNNINGGIWG